MWRASRIYVTLILASWILLVTYLFVSFGGNYGNNSGRGYGSSAVCNNRSVAVGPSSVEKIPCLIESGRRLACLRAGDEVFLPFFGFIKPQFDVTGKLSNDHFEYYTSYSKVRVPDSIAYNPFGEFGHFASYNVEIRERVRCINAENGVPMSVQWNPTPYFYPIQIAQFALQHYSRLRTVPEPRTITYESAQLKLPTNVKTEKLKTNGSTSIYFRNNEVVSSLSASVALKADAKLANLIFSWIPASESSWFSVELEEVASKRLITLKYMFANDRRCVWSEVDYDDDYSSSNKNKTTDTVNSKLSFIYSLGDLSPDKNKFANVVLDLVVDAAKAISLLQPKQEGLSTKESKGFGVRPKRLNFYGSATVCLPLRQQSTAHFERFVQAAEWFLSYQSSLGGWTVPVQRSIADERLILDAGWHSAMAQGHAISVLVRAFHLTKRTEFVTSARKALQLFRVNASDGGVVNRLFGNVWFEEYPTTPGTFVLNGFIYSLIGIFDATSLSELKEEAVQLFNTGISSLKIFLPLFDSGSGSIYDLRHLALKTAPNLARWDYHAVHIYLLKWLFNITGDKQFNDVADRWIGYAHGKMAKHN